MTDTAGAIGVIFALILAMPLPKLKLHHLHDGSQGGMDNWTFIFTSLERSSFCFTHITFAHLCTLSLPPFSFSFSLSSYPSFRLLLLFILLSSCLSFFHLTRFLPSLLKSIIDARQNERKKERKRKRERERGVQGKKPQEGKCWTSAQAANND